MNSKRFFVMLVPFLAIACFYILYIVCQRGSGNSLPGVSSDSQVAGIVVPADENEGISYDVSGFLKDGGYILFLPTRASLSSVVFYAVDSEGRYLERYEHDFSQEGVLIGESIPVASMKSPLPTLEISFGNGKGDLEDIESSKDHSVWSYGDMVLSCGDEMADENGWEAEVMSRDGSWRTPASLGMRGHGNITWELDKKAYNIKLENAMDLLGMGKACDWILLANSDDYSLIRNEVFLNLAKEMGISYQSELQQIDLFIDGDYRGTYSLATRVQIDSARVGIARDHDYLFKWGLQDENSHPVVSETFRDEYTSVVEVMDNLDDGKTDEALAIAQHFITEIETASEDDPLSDIDLTSFARYYWVQEFAKNTDATSRSFYTIWHADEGVMEVGPVWDMDRTAGVVEPFERGPDYLYPTNWAVREEEWFVPLFKNKAFVAEVRRVYEEEDLKDIFSECVYEIPERIENIRQSANMNFIRWDVLGVEQNNHILKWMGESTFDTQTEWVMAWLSQRCDFIEEAMSSGQE